MTIHRIKKYKSSELTSGSLYMLLFIKNNNYNNNSVKDIQNNYILYK